MGGIGRVKVYSYDTHGGPRYAIRWSDVAKPFAGLTPQVAKMICYALNSWKTEQEAIDYIEAHS